MWDHVKGFEQVQVDHIIYPPFFHQCHLSFIESHQSDQAQNALDVAMLAVQDHLLILCVP